MISQRLFYSEQKIRKSCHFSKFYTNYFAEMLGWAIQVNSYYIYLFIKWKDK